MAEYHMCAIIGLKWETASNLAYEHTWCTIM